MAAALQACDEDLRLLPGRRRAALAEVPVPLRRGRSGTGRSEGAFTAEVTVARQAGFMPVSLGPRILRSETAGLAMAAVLQYLYGDLGGGRTGGDRLA
jgi:16S rRNA (uracil1498-N3)-methyltransferase